MTPAQLQVIHELRDEGYTVVIFTPEEVEGIDKHDFEGFLVREGNDYIETQADNGEKEDAA